MEAQTDIQTYLERGKQELAQGNGREAAIAYAHGAQLEPENPQVHLGLAEANLALGNYGVVHMACQRTQKLQSEGGFESLLAQSLLDLLDRHYERALQTVDAAIVENPGVGYAHALRSYLLRVTGQDYDANLARARAARLSSGAHFDNCFPPIEAGYGTGYAARPNSYGANPEPVIETPPEPPRADPVPTWSQSRPNQMQRQVIRTRFALSRYSNLVTFMLIAINVIVFVIGLTSSQANDTINAIGAQYNSAVFAGEYWRLITAMFIHTGFTHVAFNMLSLYFVGSGVEVLYGKWRYLLIYMLSGIAGGLLFLFTSPGGAAVGASGAIFGIFGALGVFYIVNRRALGGMGQGALNNWIFWIVLNIVIGLVPGSGIALFAHIGGLVAGMILGFLLLPRIGGRRI